MRHFLLLLILFPFSVLAQTVTPPAIDDSAKVKTGFFHKPKIILDLDGRNSFVHRKAQKQYDAYIFGLRAGLVFRQRVRLGFGLYCLGCFGSLAPPLVFSRVEDAPDSGNVKITFGYINFFAEYIFYKSKRWEFSIPLTIGTGNAKMFFAKRASNIFELKMQKRIIAAEIALVGHFKIIKWFGVGGSIGYRNVFSNEPLFAKGLDASFWSANIEVYLGEIYRSVKEYYKNKKEQHKH